MTALLSFLLVAAVAGTPVAADDAGGAALYERECSKCHGHLAMPGTAGTRAGAVRVAARGGGLAFALPFGPDLAGVVGRAAGSVPGYGYSKAFRTATGGLVWSAPSLDAFLTDTQAFARGTRMYYRQPDGRVRARIIDYLATTTAQ